MKKKIRMNVFETNSSSCHSISINNNNLPEYETLLPSDDGYVHCGFGEFGWEVEDYADVETKLSYALTMVAETESRRSTWNGIREGFTSEEEFYETEGFRLINEAVKEVTGCNGVILYDGEIWYNDKYDWTEFNGYIDHQSSIDDYGSLKEFLDYYGLTAERFIFDSNVILHTDNDNY